MLPAALTLSALLAAPPGPPLDADVFDASQFPTVLVDVVTPQTEATDDDDAGHAAARRLPCRLGGAGRSEPGRRQPRHRRQPDDDAAAGSRRPGRVRRPRARARRRPADLTVHAVGSAVAADARTAAANIGRIQGIVAGSPDVMPMPTLVLDAAQRLADAPLTRPAPRRGGGHDVPRRPGVRPSSSGWSSTSRHQGPRRDRPRRRSGRARRSRGAKWRCQPGPAGAGRGDGRGDASDPRPVPRHRDRATFPASTC